MAFKGWERESVRLPDGGTAEAICPVIISASRATDIPAFHAAWFFERLAEGWLARRNPFNAREVQYISFAGTRLIVFWSKNPLPLLPYLERLDERGIHYYFQFTVNDYEREGLEPQVPPLDRRIEIFKTLAGMVGPARVIWRFDPLLLTDRISVELILKRIARLASRLAGYTEKLVVSFADIIGYRNVAAGLMRAGVTAREFTEDEMLQAAAGLAEIRQNYGLQVGTCAEKVELSGFGIEHNRCIDDRLIVRLFRDDPELMRFLGYSADLFGDGSARYMKDRGQRRDCGCIVSKDIGSYNSCAHGCVYCYANR